MRVPILRLIISAAILLAGFSLHAETKRKGPVKEKKPLIDMTITLDDEAGGAAKSPAGGPGSPATSVPASPTAESAPTLPAPDSSEPQDPPITQPPAKPLPFANRVRKTDLRPESAPQDTTPPAEASVDAVPETEAAPAEPEMPPVATSPETPAAPDVSAEVPPDVPPEVPPAPPEPAISAAPAEPAPRTAEPAAPTVPATPPPPAAPAIMDTELLAAIEQGFLKAQIHANGRERARVFLQSKHTEIIQTRITAGQVMENGRSFVVVLRATSIEVPAGKQAEVTVDTIALHSANILEEAEYKFSYHNAKKAEGLIAYAAEHPEFSIAAAQTAALAMWENFPLQAFAKFEPIAGTKNKPPANTAFKVETVDIVSALLAIRAMGVDLNTVALAADQQLRIEAMIEPFARETAKNYYGISEEMEWEFWRHELQQGNPATRHYALYGIARFYPDVALKMMPRWAREPRTHTVFRLSAIQALADTQRVEALPILHQLADEFGPASDLGKAAVKTAQYLEQRLNAMSNRNSKETPFRGKKSIQGL